MIKRYIFDAIVIGSGCAGLNCADWLKDFGVDKVAVVTEGINKGTSRNTGSDKQTYYKLSLSGDEGDSVMSMAKTLFDGGAMDGDVALVEASNSVRSFIKLANLGVNFPTNEYGEYVGYKTDHDPFRRATSIGPYTSKKMTEVLESSVRAKGIEIIDKCQVIELLVKDGAINGVLGINTISGEFIGIESPNVILATGGPAGIYQDSVYPLGHTGSSGLAVSAGVEMCNLAEWQYGLASIDFRWNVSGTYQQVLPRYVSIDSNGVEREFLLDYLTPEEMLKSIFLKGYEWPFDVRKIYGSSYVDLLVYNESVVKGRTVYMDFTKEPTGLENGFDRLDQTAYEYLKNSNALVSLPIERLKIMNKGAIELYKSHGIDIEKEPLKIAVCAQHNNGGVRVDSDYQTNVKGLYAIGEASGVFGIFRPGGTALNSCQVGGLRSARHVAYLGKNKVASDFEKVLDDAVMRAKELIDATYGQTDTLQDKQTEYRKAFSKNFAFLRNTEQMRVGLEEIERQKSEFIAQNKWNKKDRIARLFKNLDALTVQQAVAQSMIYTAENFGARGSGYVCVDDFMNRKPVPENEQGRSKKVVTVLKDGKICTTDVNVKPIPERDLWFERVWKEYNQITEKN